MKKKEVEKKELEIIIKRVLGEQKKKVNYKYWIMTVIFILILIPGFLHFNNKLPGEAETYVQPQPQPQPTTTTKTVDYNVSTGFDLFNIAQYMEDGQKSIASWVSWIMLIPFGILTYLIIRMFKGAFYGGLYD